MLRPNVAGDPLCRVLTIDLSLRRFQVQERPDLFAAGMGGAGVAIRLLDELCPPETEPLGPDNPIVFAVGPLVGLYPIASKTVSMFKSPHTGNLGESHAGGRSAIAIRMAGYGAIVIKGQSATPVYLVIEDGMVHFRDASALWGVRSSFTVGTVIRQREPGSGMRSIMRIGPAGERQVTYASVITETYRHFGRLGLGAVFGSKRLKAIVVSGRRELAVKNRRAYREVYDGIFQAATQSPLMQKYHELGTPMNVAPLNAIGGLPVRNLQSNCLANMGTISGEDIAKEYLGRRVACAHCPVACIHLAALRTPHPREPYFFKTTMIGYDYELIYALGSLLGGEDAQGMLGLFDLVETVGLDAMSTGVVLAWATEALERGLISLDQTDGVELAWNDYAEYAQAVIRIVSQPNDFYRALARGVEHAAGIYGGLDMALAFGGNEMPGYHTGPAAHLTYFTGARHSHLDSAGYSIDQKAAKAGERPAPQAIAQALIKEEGWRQVLSSLVVCYFARGVYTSEVIQGALSTLGIDLGKDDLLSFGADVLRHKHAFKRRHGFQPDNLRIPGRILETPSTLGQVGVDEIREGIAAYFGQL